MDIPPDRRVTERKVVHFVAEIEVEGAIIGCGVSRDASARGLLLLTHVDLAPGTQITLRLLVPGEDSPRLLSASIVRRERIAPGEAVWAHKLAVALADPPQDLEQIVDRLTKGSRPPPSV
jgi:PilZ domain